MAERELMRSPLFELLCSSTPEHPILDRPIAPVLPELKPSTIRALTLLGLSEQEAKSEVDRINRLTVRDCLPEMKAWLFIYEKSNCLIDSARSGFLTSRIHETCLTFESMMGGTR